MNIIDEYCEDCDDFNSLGCLECDKRVEKEDLLERIENLDNFIRNNKIKNTTISLNLTHRELRFIKMWIKTAYANDDFLNDDLGLNRRNEWHHI